MRNEMSEMAVAEFQVDEHQADEEADGGEGGNMEVGVGVRDEGAGSGQVLVHMYMQSSP